MTSSAAAIVLRPWHLVSLRVSSCRLIADGSPPGSSADVVRSNPGTVDLTPEVGPPDGGVPLLVEKLTGVGSGHGCYAAAVTGGLVTS
jgi:hypothetical protein